MDISTLQNIFIGFLLSGVLGALIGIDKDIGKHKKISILKWSSSSDWEFGSIRTYALIAILGALMTWFDMYLETWDIFILSGLVSTTILVSVYYSYSVFKEKAFSPATELVSFLTYFVWVLVFLGYAQIAIIFAILLIFLLSSKDMLEGLGKYISKDELRTTLKFAAIAFVILPLLPDARFSLSDISWFLFGRSFDHPLTTFTFFNPYSIWFFVVIMSGVSYLGYILTKFVGSNSGVILSSMLWGMVSSTATTASMTQKSKEDSKNINSYVIGTLLASCIMFVRVFAVVLFFSASLFSAILIPGGVMFLTFLSCTGYFYWKSRSETVKKSSEEENLRSPFRIVPALQFAGVIVLIKFISGVGIIYKDIWGEGLFYSALGIISGLADVDAITQTMAVDSGLWKITFAVAASTVLLAVMSNNFVKWTIAWKLWNPQFWKRVMGSFLLSIFAWLLIIGVLNFM
jgi:uncharacterized membrane protein (DUF4010 family)